MYRDLIVPIKVAIVFLSLMALSGISSASSAPPSSYNPALRRYPYLTDVVGSYATINWATDRSETTGGVRYGKVGSESCTAHYAPATKADISVNGVLQYQWKALLELTPGRPVRFPAAAFAAARPGRTQVFDAWSVRDGGTVRIEVTEELCVEERSETASGARVTLRYASTSVEGCAARF